MVANGGDDCDGNDGSRRGDDCGEHPHQSSAKVVMGS